MPWYAYKRGGWEIAVDAVSKKDAASYIAIYAPGAVSHGEMIPPTSASYSTLTAMTTPARQEQIIENNKCNSRP